MSSSTLKVGIIGLPNVGKSTLFNAILGRQAALTAPYPFATVEPNVGVVDVPDERLVKLRDAMFPPIPQTQRPNQQPTTNNQQPPLVFANITFVDIAGLVKGASEGNGLGNKFLSHIRDVDLILHVLRDFEADGVPRHQDSKNPIHDAEIVEMELGLKDLELKEKNPEYRDYLAKKPVIYAVNIGEEKLEEFSENSEYSENQKIRESENQRSRGSGVPVLGFSESPALLQSEFSEFSGRKKLIFCAKIEEEISQLSKIEQKEFLKVYGLETSGLDRIVTECFHRLGLISFFTSGKIEVKAWPVKKGVTAPQAAGTIHSDFEKLFIRAEIISWEKLAEAGSWQEAKDRGWVRTEGRDYVVQNGDVCNFLVGK